MVDNAQLSFCVLFVAPSSQILHNLEYFGIFWIWHHMASHSFNLIISHSHSVNCLRLSQRRVCFDQMNIVEHNAGEYTSLNKNSTLHLLRYLVDP